MNKMQFRSASITQSDDPQTFTAVIATSHPVARVDKRGRFNEVLDPSGAVPASESLPVLLDHRQSARETVGVATNFRVEDGKLLADIRLTTATDAEPIRQRVADGTLSTFSIGYSVAEFEENRAADGTRTKTVTKFGLLEVSITPIPADPHAKKRNADMAFDQEQRNTLIETLRSACNLPENWGDDFDNEAVTDEEIRAAAFEEMSKRNAPKIRVNRSHDDPAAIQARKAGALAYRMAGGTLPEESREFVGMSLLDHAADATGISTRGHSADEILSRALGTSDLPQLVSNAMGKVAALAYQAAQSPIKALARQRTLPNFKTSTALRLGEMGRLEEMTEHGEFTHTSRAESGETLSLKTFGRAINVSRKLLIDDDLGLLGDMTSAMGQAAAQTEAEEMVAMLTGNPTLSDGTPVFDASRGNSVAVALSEGALSDARQHMRTVTGLDGKTIIDARPKYLVVGAEIETAAEKLLASIYATSTDDVNAFAGKLQLVVEPRIAGDGWFLLADPAQVPSLQYAYLAAAQGVQIQRQEAWDTLGLKYRAWLDFGAGWLDWRGAYHSAGA